MTFREFVDDVRGAAESLIRGRRVQRDVTPMIVMRVGDDDIAAFAVEAAFFASRDDKQRLIDNFVLPIVREQRASAVAWILPGIEHTTGADVESLLVVAFDGEREATWLAPLIGEGIGQWRALPPNESESIFIQPIQEALR